MTLRPITRQTAVMFDNICEAPVMVPGYPNQSKGLDVSFLALCRVEISHDPYHWLVLWKTV